jgi:hypothetical protein
MVRHYYHLHDEVSKQAMNGLIGKTRVSDLPLFAPIDKNSRFGGQKETA